MRQWLPWSLVAVLGVLVALGVVTGATSGGPGATTHRDLSDAVSTPARETIEAVPPGQPPQGGYHGIENFCAVAPLAGTIHYDGRRDDLADVFTVDVTGLPPDDEVNINWSNNAVRAPVVAAFETDAAGGTVQSSLVVSRLGEVRGVGIVLGAAVVPNQPLGRLEPC